MSACHCPEFKFVFFSVLVFLCVLVSASQACVPAQVGCSCGSAHDAEGRLLHTDTVWCNEFPENNNVKKL